MEVGKIAGGRHAQAEESVNVLLVLMVLCIWFLMNHHGFFVQPP